MVVVHGDESHDRKKKTPTKQTKDASHKQTLKVDGSLYLTSQITSGWQRPLK